MTPSAISRALDLYALVIGACLGSFLNVVIARLPRGRSLVRPSSSCPRCGARIAWHDNVPIVSWLVLRGKCRSCGEPISARYPIVEVLTAVLVFAVWRRFGAQPATLGYAAFACALVALTYIDLDTWLLPHEITWPLVAAGLASPLWNRQLAWPDSAIGAAAGFAFFAVIALIGEKLLDKETMGWGDVWLLSGIGAWLGWRALLPVVLLSAVQGALVGVVLIALGRGPAEKARAARARQEAEPTSTDGSIPASIPTQSPIPGPTADPSANEFLDVPAEPVPTTAPPPFAAPFADDDWLPPPHAVPFGPFLALGALEVLLVGDALARAYFSALGRILG